MVKRMSLSENGSVRMLRCGVGSDWFGLDESRVRGIRRLSQPWKRQPTAGSQLGFLPGPTPVPLHSLHALLQQPGEAAGGSYVVMLQDEQQSWGLLAEKVAATVTVPVGQIHPLPALLGAQARHWLQDVAVLEDGLLLRLAVDRLLAPVAERSTPEKPMAAPATSSQSSSSKSRSRASASQALLCQLREAQGGSPALFCVFSLSQTCDIREPLPLKTVPGTPPWLAGIANWRGQPLPIVDAGTLARQPTSRETRQRIVVVHGPQGEKIGFLVPALMQLVAKLPAATPLPLNSVPLPSRVLHGAWRTAERQLVMLSLDGLYRNDEGQAG